MSDENRGGIGRRGFIGGLAATVGGTGLLGITAGAAAAADVRATHPGQLRGPGRRHHVTEPTSGPVRVSPSDQQYPELVSGVNNRYVSHPDEVYLVDSIEQVPAIVQAAVDRRLKLCVRSGGHCLENFVDNPSTQIVLDLSQLNATYFDPAMNAFAVETGATLLAVYETLYKMWGITIPAGICYSVGMGGHVSGGGWGLLCRQHGLVIDHLYAVEVVVVGADGRVRRVIATREAGDPNRELWWAHAGGGGGNFGVITRYWFRSPRTVGTDPHALLPKPPESVYLAAIAWPWRDMGEAQFSRLVTNYGRWFATHSAPGDPGCALASFLVLNHSSVGEIDMVTQVDATVPNARQMLDDYLRAITDGLAVTHGAMTRPAGEFGILSGLAEPRLLPWLEATKYLGTTNAHLTDPTFRQEYKSAYMRSNFPPDQVAVMYRQLTRTDVVIPGASVTLSSYGGQVNQVLPSATAYPHRESVFKMMWMSLWNDPAEDDTYISWNRQFYAELYAATGGVPVPNDVTDGCYVNYPDIDLNDPQYNSSGVRWHDLYYKSNYPRLQRVKAKWDPTNFFRHAQSVRLPGA